MLVGLCGNAGVGKDAVADFLVKNHGFVRVALADPLKRICQDVYGFTDEQLWGSSRFRNMPDRRYPRKGDYYEYPHCPAGAVWLPLYNNRGFFLVDAEDAPGVVAHRWTLNKKEDGKNTDYVRATIDGKKVSLHAHIAPGYRAGLVVDHINGNGLDNRKRNLRVCTNEQNRHNAEKRKDGESVFKGVGRAHGRDGWRAYVNTDGTLKTIGYFATEEEAALAYDIEAARAFGAFARLNSDRFLTPRYALQQLGSEWGRNCSPDTWVRYALSAAEQLLRDPYLMYTAKEGVVPVVAQTSQGEWQRDDAPNSPCSGVVISDVRFRNEIDAIHAAGGKVVRITRKERPDHQGLIVSAAAHISETEQKELPDDLFDHHLINGGASLELLEAAVAELAAALRTA